MKLDETIIHVCMVEEPCLRLSACVVIRFFLARLPVTPPPPPPLSPNLKSCMEPCLYASLLLTVIYHRLGPTQVSPGAVLPTTQVCTRHVCMYVCNPLPEQLTFHLFMCCKVVNWEGLRVTNHLWVIYHCLASYPASYPAFPRPDFYHYQYGKSGSNINLGVGRLGTTTLSALLSMLAHTDSVNKICPSSLRRYNSHTFW